MSAVCSEVGFSRARRAGWLLAVCALGGCANLVEVRTLATGRSDVAAYELRGTELAPLRREARRLCPQGGEIVRQAGHDLRPEREDGRWRRWAQAASEWVDPPRRDAQLLLVCKENAAAAALSAADDAPAVDGAGRVPSTPAGLPIGPLNIEW